MTLDPSGAGASAHPGLNLSETLRDCLVTGILGVDDTRRVTILTPGAETLLHVKAAQVLRQPYDLLPHPLPAILREAQETGKNQTEQSLSLRDPHGGQRLLRISLSPVCRKEADRRGVLMMIHDLEAMQRMETHLRRMDRLASIGTMSASFAHEIKNALTPVKTFLQLALEKEPASEMGSLVLREVDRVAMIVGQMLRFAGPDRPAFVVLGMNDLLDQSLKLLRHQLESKNIRVDVRWGAPDDRVLADAYQMEQAYLNILINAVEAMSPGGSLSVSSQEAASEEGPEGVPMLRLVIEDSGEGIDPANMDRLFETFFTTKPHGTGLGLAITKRILKEHRGQISIESRLHDGTRVTIDLPLAQTDSQAHG